MAEERIVIKRRKEIPQYIRFGTCLNCGAEMAVKGTRYDIEDYSLIYCQNCGKAHSVFLSSLHKADGWYAKRKLRKVKNNENKN